jgi:DNA repair protein RadD
MPPTSERVILGGNSNSIPPKINQAKRRVWDILNAGPRNRFTAEGLLVSNCKILDFAGNIAYHGPIDRVDPKRPRGKGGGIAPVKVCPKCDSIIFAGFRTCPDCGYEWPIKPKHAARAVALSILSDGSDAIDRPLDGWVRVRDVFYSRAQKDASKLPTLRCTYAVEGGKTVQKWIAVESPNEYAQSKARQWFIQHGIAETEIPRTVMEAMRLISHYKKPRRILVKQEGQYPNVLSYQF